jgi:hypothetical protein
MTIARSTCVLAVLAAVGLALWLPTAIRGQAQLRGHFSERTSDGYRGAGRYELQGDGTTTLWPTCRGRSR